MIVVVGGVFDDCDVSVMFGVVIDDCVVLSVVIDDCVTVCSVRCCY